MGVKTIIGRTTAATLLVSLALWGNTAQATDMTVYGAAMDYGTSPTRDKGRAAGVYLGSAMGADFVEAELDRTYVDYSSAPQLLQHDVTIALNHYPRSGEHWRYGVHGTVVDKAAASNVVVLFGGLQNYRLYDKRLGIDMALSHYPGDDREVLQLSPMVGTTAGTAGDYVDLELHADFIGVWDNGRHDTYSALAASVGWRQPRYGVTLGAWAGRERFALHDGGFVLYNLDTLHRGGWDMKLSWYLPDQWSLNASYQVDRIQESNGADINKRTTVLSTGHSW